MQRYDLTRPVDMYDGSSLVGFTTGLGQHGEYEVHMNFDDGSKLKLSRFVPCCMGDLTQADEFFVQDFGNMVLPVLILNDNGLLVHQGRVGRSPAGTMPVVKLNYTRLLPARAAA